MNISMETRDQWYKPNLLYNIHWRPPKQPEAPKMIVETVRFNPSVCTCGEHDCEPRYRMEKRVLWTNKDLPGTKLKMRESSQLKKRIEIMSEQVSKQGYSRIDNVQGYSVEDGVVDKIEGKDAVKNVFNEDTVKKETGEINALYCAETTSNVDVRACRNSCDNENASINENKEGDDVESSGEFVETGEEMGCGGDNRGHSNGVDKNGHGQSCSECNGSSYDNGLKKKDERVDGGVKNCGSNSNCMETKAHVKVVVDGCYGGNSDSVMTDDDMEIDIDNGLKKEDEGDGGGVTNCGSISNSVMGVDSGCHGELGDESSVRNRNKGISLKTDANELNQVVDDGDGIQSNNDYIVGGEIRAGECDRSNDGECGRTVKKGIGHNGSVSKSDDVYGRPENPPRQNYDSYDENGGGISSAFGIMSIYCNSELHCVIQRSYSSDP